MKHAGSQEALRARIDPESATTSPRRRLLAAVRRQSSLSWLASFLCALFLVAVMADAPMRDLARSLDTSVVSILRVVTQFGNSAWPLGLSLLLFAALTIVSRTPNPFSPASLQNLRSALILVIGSVALSGAIASLTKNMIGRARPSTGATAHVFDFAIMSFRAGWTSKTKINRILHVYQSEHPTSRRVVVKIPSAEFGKIWSSFLPLLVAT